MVDGQQIVSAECAADDQARATRDAAVQMFTRVSALGGQLSLQVDFEDTLANIRKTLTLLALEMNRLNEFSLWLDHQIDGKRPQ